MVKPRKCRKCGSAIEYVRGVWVVVEPGFTSDGLGYCPPNPDAKRHGDHIPVEKPWKKGAKKHG